MALQPSSKLNSLGARPPTPPRSASRPAPSAMPLDVDETLDDAVQYLDDAFEIERLTSSETRKVQKPLVNTPQQSPCVASDNTRTSSKRKHKVAFAPFTSWNYHKSPNYANTPSNQPPLRALPSSREKENVSVRSILKSAKQTQIDGLPRSSSPTKQNNVSAHHFNSLPDMLEAVTQQLALEAGERSNKIDAYVAVCRTLEAYKKVPDIESLKSNTSRLLQFIRRDISSLNAVTNGPDVAIITSALKLLACLSRIPEVAEEMDDLTCMSFVDLSISALQDSSFPKALINHHLFAMAAYKYNAKILKQDRFVRLLDAVRGVHDHMKGNSIPGYQIEIYRRLIEQVPELMAGRLSQWLDVVLSCLLSDVEEIRERAIKFGLYTSLQLSSRIEITDFIDKTFDSEIEGKSYGHLFIERLNGMLSTPSTATCVPRIWSVVNLLSRTNFSKSWVHRHLRSWISINQKAFTSSVKIKAAARFAWIRYIFCVYPSLSTEINDQSILLKPVNAYFVDMKSTDFSTESAQASLSMYLGLLYYSLRPNVSFEHSDLYWNRYVRATLDAFSSKSREHSQLACQILTSLLTSSAVWRETRAFEDSNFQIEELPRLDSKWIRSRLRTVLDLVRRFIFNATASEQPVGLKNLNLAIVEVLWTALVSSLSEAGSKEITLSKDARNAVAELTNFFNDLRRSKALTDTNIVQRLIETSARTLGAAAFAETYLSHDGHEGSFDVAPTPTSRSSKLTAHPLPAAAHIIGLVLRTASNPASNRDEVMLVAKSVLQLCCASRKLRFSKLELLASCASAICDEYLVGDDEVLLRANGLGLCLEAATDAFNASAQVNLDRTSQVGRDFQAALHLMEKCLCDTYERTPLLLESFYGAIVRSAQSETGDGGLLLATTEPHAAFVSRNFDESVIDSKYPSRKSTIFSYALAILSHDVRPKHPRRDIERGRAALWGSSKKERHLEIFDPYNHLYVMITRGMIFIYDHFNVVDETQSTSFLEAVRAYVANTSSNLRGTVIRNIQDGIAVFVEDASRKLKQHTAAYAKVKQFFSIAIETLQELNNLTSNHLETFETLIAAGLSSSRQSIVNMTVLFWNSTFGMADDLQYSTKVEYALRRLRPFVELKLPGLVESIEIDNMDALSLDDSGGDMESDQDLHLMPRQLSRSPAPPHIRLSYSPARAVSAQSNIRKPRGNSPVKPQVKAPLRHDDSQIEFARIESSPVPEEDFQLLTDRQKDVAERQRHDAAAMFPDIQSSPIYKRLQRDEHNTPEISHNSGETAAQTAVFDCDDLFDILRSPEGRAATPMLDVPSDALGYDLPKSSSPLRSSPITAALSRRSTPRKPDDDLKLQEQDDDVPSSPPNESIEEVEEATQEFDMEAFIHIPAAVSNDDEATAIRKDANEGDCLVNGGNTPSVPTEMDGSNDNSVNQAEAQLENVSSFADDTDIITGTEECFDEMHEQIAQADTQDDGQASKDDQLATPFKKFTEFSSPAHSSSALLADAQLRAEMEASIQYSAGQQYPEVPIASAITGIDGSVISDSFKVVIPGTKDDVTQSLVQVSNDQGSTSIEYDSYRDSLFTNGHQAVSSSQDGKMSKSTSSTVPDTTQATTSGTPKFTKLEDAVLDHVLRVFHEDPHAELTTITVSTIGFAAYIKSGRSRKYRERSAKDAWENLSHDQRSKIQIPAELFWRRATRKLDTGKNSSTATISISDESIDSDAVLSGTPDVSQSNESLSQRRSRRERGRPAAVVPFNKAELSQAAEPAAISQKLDEAVMETEPEHANKRGRKSSVLSQQMDLAPTAIAEPSIEHALPVSPIQTRPKPKAIYRASRKRRIPTDAEDDPIQGSGNTSAVETRPTKRARRMTNSTTGSNPPNQRATRRTSQVQAVEDSIQVEELTVTPSNVNGLSIDTPTDHAYQSDQGFNEVDMIVGDGIDVSTEQDDGLKQAVDQSIESVPSADPSFSERFNSFSEYCKTFFEDCKITIETMSKEECDQVEEKLERLEEELRTVIKEVRRVGKAKRS